MLKKPLVFSITPDVQDTDWAWASFVQGNKVIEEVHLENDSERIQSAVSAIIRDIYSGKYQ